MLIKLHHRDTDKVVLVNTSQIILVDAPEGGSRLQISHPKQGVYCLYVREMPEVIELLERKAWRDTE